MSRGHIEKCFEYIWPEMQFEKCLVDQAASSPIDNEIIFLAAKIPQVRVTRHKTQKAFAILHF